MSAALQIPSYEVSTSSGYGCSYWLPFLDCPRKAFLERATGRRPVEVDEDGDRKTDRWGHPKKDQAKVGTLFHKLLEFYHPGKMSMLELEYQDGAGDLEWLEAQRLFRYYRKLRPPDFFGKVLACENLFKFGCLPCLKGEHPICEEGQHAIDTIGVPYFTGRIDMENQIESQDQIDRWVQMGAGDLSVGNLIFVDTKTHTKKSNNFASEKLESVQFHSYMMVAREQGRAVKGMLANAAISYKDMEDPKNEPFPLVFVPFPTDQQQRAVKDAFTMARLNRALYGEDFANLKRCHDYFKNCMFLNNKCDRTNYIDTNKVLRILNEL